MIEEYCLILDAMELATTLAKKEYGDKSYNKGLHFEYRQGAMDAIIKIFKNLNMSKEEYVMFRKTLGLSEIA